MMKTISKPVIILLSILMMLTVAFDLSAQSNGTQNKENVRWFNNKQWLNGLQLTPHPSVDKQEFAKQYHKNKEWWDTAFNYLKKVNLKTLKPGTYPVDGKNVYVIISDGPTKTFEDSKWEAHRHYNDIQYIWSGKEKIGIAPVTSAAIIGSYDDAKDLANYTAEGKYYISSPDQFFIFFPNEAHRPSINVKGYGSTKKIVVKVRTGE